LRQYQNVFETLKESMEELDMRKKEKNDLQRFQDLNMKLQKQEELFQDLVLYYNQNCKTDHILVNPSVSVDKQYDSGIRIEFKRDKASN